MDGVIVMWDKKYISLNKFSIFLIIFSCSNLRWIGNVIISIIDGCGMYMKTNNLKKNKIG